MTIPFNQAISAYNQAAKDVGAGATIKNDKVTSNDFADMLKNKVRTAIDDNKNAERLSVAAVAGKADLSQVVTAVAEAEFTVKAAVAIKDKVITSYKQILRMPV
ncbi:MAG: flagellar hook-basal body complex protein FliE [Alphaproteobacteria bacterium]|nr:flagellar hook-basal body complex protein FliE [Rhodospirillales bacterium]MCW9046101.1 flagellar hook-basal body complex protein FliE [Alphaproteobacteria bacterium]